MCLAIPAEVIEVIEPYQAKVSIAGIEKVVQTQLIDQPKVGDFLLIHVGVALSIIDKNEAKLTLDLIEKMQKMSTEQES